MFQTKVEIPHSSVDIAYTDNILTLGSCFAENMGRKLSDAYFGVDCNPFGVLYNPVSIRNSLHSLLYKDEFTEVDLFENRSLWQSFSHSSLFSDISVEKCLDKINLRFKSAKTLLGNANFLIITFGTSWVYEDRKSGSVVSNCHKLPSKEFVRRRLTVAEMVSDYTELINKLQVLYPHLQFIFSVSPIRHWKDGAHENNISKSALLMAIDSLQKAFSQVHYFPSYEIQLDELRDYRFYTADMLHPSDVAAQYIWERFSETYFAKDTLAIMKQLQQLRTDLQHRPLFPESEEYQRFLKNTSIRKEKLLREFSFLEGRL